MMGMLILPRLFLSLLTIPEISFSAEIFGGSVHYDATELDAISAS